MNIFDIIGPVMVGPSSSHTAGAVRIGYIARKLLGEPVRRARVELYGSFLATGKGHGTDRAIAAGLLGMQPDDMRIPDSLTIAGERGVEIAFGEAKLKEAHPNTARLLLEGTKGGRIDVEAASLGGGRIRVERLDGIGTSISGEYPTLIVRNEDSPGHVTGVTAAVAGSGVNIAAMQVYRDGRGGNAVMVLECDQEIPQACVEKLRASEGIRGVVYLSLEEREDV